MKKVFGQTVRDLKREVNKKVLKLPGIEQKILDATNNEPWGPHGSHLANIAQATQNYQEYQLIMSVIWKRINDTGKNWRHVYKGLIVLEYLVVNGSERVIEEIRQHAHQISTLSDFQYIDSSGKDQGVNVRKKSQSLVSLVSSKERILEVRGKASVYREKYHIKDEDHNDYGKGQSRSHPGSYGDDNYDVQSGNDDHHFGQKTSNSDIVNSHSFDADDDRQLENKFTEQNIGAPPSYEEATKDAQNDIHTERDAEALTSSSQEKASPSKPKLTSSAESTNQEASVKFDPCGSGSAAPHTASEMDLFGSFTDDSTNSSFPLPTTSNTTVETDLTSILGFNDNFAAPSSVSSVPNKLSEDPFGDSPFKALPQEDSITQPQKETSLSLTQPSFKSIDISEPLPLSGTTPTVENYSGFAFDKSSNNGVGYTLSSTLNGQPASTTSELFLQDLPVAQSNNDILGDIFPQIGPTTAIFSETAPAVTLARSQTTTSSLFMQASLSNPTNPFTRSGISSEEASPNPFTQSSVSSQATLPNPFVESSLSLQAPSNPFAESGLSMQDTPPNPFAQSSLSTQDSHPNPYAQSASSVSVANHATHLGLSSNGFPQSELSSSKSDTNLAESGSLAPVASQGFPPNYVAQSGLSSSKSAMNLVESGLPVVVASQGISPNYMAQSGLSLQATTNLTQLGLSAPVASSQGLPPNDIAQSRLSSQATPNFSQSGLTAPLATQVLPPDNITLSSQATPNLIQLGLTAPLAAHGLHPDCIAQPRLSSQVTPNLTQKGLTAPLYTQGLPPSYIAQSRLSSQATPTLSQPGLSVSQGFPEMYIAESGLSSQASSSIPLSGLPAPQSGLLAPSASQGLPQTYTIQSGLSSQTPSNTALSGLTAPSTLQATPSTTTASLTKTIQPKEKFEPKSTVWADTLSRGLVNLDISGAKTNPLADIGIDFDSINRKEKRKEEKNTSTLVSTVTMGKAMGSGSGIGRVGATSLAAPPNPMMGSGMGMGGFGGIGGYGGGMNQPMGMGMGLNMGIGMGQGAAMQPGFGMPSGSGVAPHPGMPGIGYNQMMGTNGHGYQRPYGGGGGYS